MSVRFDLMSAILNVRTGEAVQAALDHALDMTRLCRGDNQGVRSYVPVALTLIKIRLMQDLDSLHAFVLRNPSASGETRYDHLQEEAMSNILLN